MNNRLIVTFLLSQLFLASSIVSELFQPKLAQFVGVNPSGILSLFHGRSGILSFDTVNLESRSVTSPFHTSLTVSHLHGLCCPSSVVQETMPLPKPVGHL